MRHIELNPVRARMARKPANYAWSSHSADAPGGQDPVLTAHPLYSALGAKPSTRAEAYRALFGAALPAGFVDELRSATNGG